MDWVESNVVVDGAAAAVIAAGMKAVARADGESHPRELELIAAFEAQAGDAPPHPTAALTTSDLRDTYVRTLVMVALADGAIGPEEDAVIRALAGAVGVEGWEVDARILEVKRYFFEAFKGVKVFRETVEQIGESLGLSEEQIQQALDAAEE